MSAWVGREFVLANWSYCTLLWASLVLFAFDLYDKDTSGQLSWSSRRWSSSSWRCMAWSTTRTHTLGTSWLSSMSGHAGLLNIHNLGDLCKRHPALLMPAFLYQDAIHHRICGPR